MGTLNIIKEPSGIDFAGNNPHIELLLNGYGIESQSYTTITFHDPNELPHTSKGGYLQLDFFGHTVTFRVTSNKNSEHPEEIIWDIFTASGMQKLLDNFNLKIKNHYLISKYYNVYVYGGVGNYITINFTGKYYLKNSAITPKVFGTLSGKPTITETDGENFTIPVNWKLWSKFIIGRNMFHYTETPDMLFDVGEDRKIKIPFKLLNKYFTGIDLPSPSETFAMYPLQNHSIDVKCKYAEAFGSELKVQCIYETGFYRLIKGEINPILYKQQRIDWQTKEEGYLTSINSVIPWGMSTDQVVRSFPELPQWIYISTLHGVNTTIAIDIDIVLRQGNKIKNTYTKNITGGQIYRIPVSLKALSIDHYDVLKYDVTLSEAGNTFFIRTYQMITKPYNARIFIFENQYGLFESFFIDNLLEEKTIKGDVVVLQEDHKIDVNQNESTYTARTGKKRISELQLLKYAVEKEHHYFLQDDMLIPVTISPSKYKIAEELDDLQDVEFDFIVTAGAKPIPIKDANSSSGNISSIALVSVHPDYYQTDVALDAAIEVVFSDAIQPGNSSLITVKDSQNNIIPVNVQINNNKMTLGHSQLTRGETYTVSIPMGATINYRDNIKWSFTTINEIYIVEIQPINNSVNLPVNQEIKIVFNQSVTLHNAALITLIDNTGISLNITPNVIDNTLFISHDGLTAGTNYQLIIETGAITDYDEDIEINFSTNAALELISFTPPYLSINQEPDVEIKFIFNQPIEAGENIDLISIIGYILQDESATPYPEVNLIPVISGNTLTIKHDRLPYNRTYRVFLEYHAVKDFGNYYLNFDTRVAPLNPLMVTDYFPSGNFAPVNQPITVTFNDDITILDDNEIVLVGQNGRMTTNVTITAQGNIMTINHPDLEYNTKYIIWINQGALQDFENTYSFEFTTKSSLSIRSLTPLPFPLQMSANPNAQVKVSFNQNISPGNTSLIKITRTNDNQDVPITVNIVNDELRLLHSNFSAGYHIVTIPAGAILDYNAAFSWKFFVL